MKKNILYTVTFLIIFTSTILVSRSWRPSQIPNGNKFSCNTCHTNGGGTPRNPFGQEVEKRVTPGGTEDFWGPALAAIDSDGDGFTNGQELGDPNGVWRPGQPDPGNSSNVSAPGDPNSRPPITNVAEVYLPTHYRLLNNYPNPFNPSTKIVFEIPQSENVSLVIYNIAGQLIRTLADENFPAGRFEKVWDGRDNLGREVSSGIYIYRLKAGAFNRSARMVLMK
ncbi:MAG: T9SS type A sorting domain-containing protein [Bacteroidota bacterium]